uniref:uncharacterized protein LOC120327967 n=1 Tax=Styela clava TaxID=7725 RepID=UPI001939A297|nr:uncharacterized protein LOC120327967 [Styela clava]
MAGMDWWGEFRKRHNDLLTIRKPQSLSFQRAVHLNRPIVNKFFDLLESTMLENFVFGEPSRIYNVDGTSLSLVPGVKNIVGLKSSRYSSQITSVERGLSQTVVMAVNAVGDYVPPMGIYKDGHGSHTRSIEVLDFAANNNIEIVSLPPHTSHYLQPLDKLHFEPLKDYYKETVRNSHEEQSGGWFDQIQFPNSFLWSVHENMAYILAFKSTGIYPLDKDQIPEHAYAPAETTDVSGIVMESSPSTSGIVPVNEEVPVNERSFDDSQPYPKVSRKNKPPQKKPIETGSRVLTSKNYRKELSALMKPATQEIIVQVSQV